MNEPEPQVEVEGDAARQAEKHAAMFQMALQSANGGKLENAEEICRQILQEDAFHPSALYMLGALYCQRGKLDAGIDYLQRLVKLRPDSVSPYFQLGNALAARNRPEEAVAQYEQALTVDPDNADIHTNLGLAYSRLQRANEAEAAFRRAVELNPQNFSALNNLGNCLAAGGDLAAAEAMFRRALATSPNFAPAHNNLGNVLREQGKLEEAAAAYRDAINLNNNYFEAFFSLGNVLSQQQQYEAAELVYRRAVELRPDHLDALVNLASAVDVLDRPAEVIRLCERALRIDSTSYKAFYLLAGNYEVTNRLDLARQMITEGLAYHPDHPDLNLIAAKIERRDGKPESGEARLRKFLPVVRSNPMEQAYEFELGRLYDEQGDYAQAFEHFSAGNRIAKKNWDSAHPGPNEFQQTIRRKLELATPDWVARWNRVDLPRSGAATPIFLVGFPRSGTTLLEQVCDSHPAIKALDEYPAVNAVARKLDELAGGHADALARLDARQIADLRNAYFNAVDQRLTRRADYQLIDKFPLNLVNADLIHRIFPGARFIFALRHPLDVCLSCYMQDFRLNPGVANFCELENAAETYAMVMRLWQRLNELLPLKVHTVRYETLVSNFEAEVRELVSFCGIPWDDKVLEYASHSRERAKIKTPSYHQVSRPIYTEARFRWERYAEQLEPIRATLEPFIEAFGYGD